jgi:hypothetical protein
MTLAIATEGCCKGHPCDNCKTCRSGRCCRKDNPDYKLPGLGEWDGPIYGELGVLNDDGEKVECHCCGNRYRTLAYHLSIHHNLTADEYRSIFGLRATQGLNSADYGLKLAQSNTEHLRRIRPVREGNGNGLTPEQQSARVRGRQVRLQDRIEHGWRKAVGSKPKPARTYCKSGRHLLTDDNYAFVGGMWRCLACRQESEWRREPRKREREKARELYGDKARLNFPDG